MPRPLRIAAVFATMNRAETAIECVLALARQSRPPQSVLVADNCSTDDTASRLEDLENLPFQLIVLRMPSNVGNAGGVEATMERAFDDGADAVWILDDDSWPRERALEALLDGPWDPKLVKHPLQIDPKSGKFSWPLQITDGRGGWRLAWSELDLPDGACISSRIAWTGALLPKAVRDAVGPVNGDLFIRGEDEEFPWRIKQAGFSFEVARNSVMDHPGPENIIHWQLFGINFFFERSLADWKLYYKVRNMIWLKRRQGSEVQALALALTYAIATAWIDGSQRLPLVWEAARDGWYGILGKWRSH